MTPISATSNNSNGSNNSNVGPFGDTTYTKVFVGGLAWETQKDTMKNYFEQFGEILEAVVITDKATGRSKGYGFVTFREPDAAMRACVDAAPVIDGRRANCNLASLGVQRSKPSTPKHGAGGGGMNFRVMNSFQSGFQGGVGTTFPSAAAAFPHYAIQQGLPYNVYAGYPPYSQDYAYTPSYYNVYGGTSGQYPVYGHGAASGLGGMMTGGAATGMAFFPSYLQFGTEGSGAGAGTGYSYTSGQGYGLQYPYHGHQQHNLVQYSAMNSSTGTYPHHYGPPISLAPSPALHSGVTKVLPASIPHR